MIVGIDPKVDYAFKHLFGRDVTRPLLLDLLNSILDPAPAHRIRDIELLNPFNAKEALDDKLSILDIKARDQSGRQFNIEMQMLAFPYYEKRILYYLCKLHQQQLHERQNYAELKPTISISFLNHVLFGQVPNGHLCFRLLEASHHIPLTEDMEFHILELPKFTKSAAELAGGLDVWLYFLRHAEMMDLDALPAPLQQPVVVHALEELKMLTQTDLERERYEARRKAQLDENTLVRVAHMEGRAQGREEGRAQEKMASLVWNIHFCEQLLHRPQTPREQLAARSLEELARLAEELQGQALKQS